jgi:hypothetical protein
MEHGYRQYRRGCRCDVCRAANTALARAQRQRTYEARGYPVKERPPKPDHGSRSRYVRGCRCEPCTAANTIGTRAWRAKPIEKRYITHGASGYTSACRCEICTEAHRTYMRAYMRTYRAKQAVTAEVHDG